MRALEHVHRDLRCRPEAAALDQDALLVEHVRRLDDLAVGGKHGRAGQAGLHQLEAHQPVVHVLERRALEIDHVDLDALGRQVVEERADDAGRIAVQEECAVDQVDSHQPERFLLLFGVGVLQRDVDGDVRRRLRRDGLKAHPQPAVAILLARVAARRDRVGEDEELGARPALRVEPLDQQLVFVIEHGLQPPPADVAIARAVDRVAEGHVVGRHRLRDRARRAADAEEPARHFLARPDLGEGAVFGGVQIDLQGLVMRVELVLVHGDPRSSVIGSAPQSLESRQSRGLRPAKNGAVHRSSRSRCARRR